MGVEAFSHTRGSMEKEQFAMIAYNTSENWILSMIDG